jgi:hypothetical protein
MKAIKDTNYFGKRWEISNILNPKGLKIKTEIQYHYEYNYCRICQK